MKMRKGGTGVKAGKRCSRKLAQKKERGGAIYLGVSTILRKKEKVDCGKL